MQHALAHTPHRDCLTSPVLTSTLALARSGVIHGTEDGGEDVGPLVLGRVDVAEVGEEDLLGDEVDVLGAVGERLEDQARAEKVDPRQRGSSLRTFLVSGVLPAWTSGLVPRMIMEEVQDDVLQLEIHEHPRPDLTGQDGAAGVGILVLVGRYLKYKTLMIRSATRKVKIINSPQSRGRPSARQSCRLADLGSFRTEQGQS